MAKVKKLTGYAGFGVWAADKMKTADDAMDAYKLSNDPAKLSEAVTKWAEIAAGFAVGEIVNKVMSKERLDKVMDSMRSKSTKFDRMMKDKPTYSEYKQSENLKKNAAGYASGMILDFVLSQAKDAINNNGALDSTFETYDDILSFINRHRLLDSAFRLFDRLFGIGKTSSIEENVNDGFGSALNWTAPRRRDPLVLDLDGDGIETTAADGSVNFDHDGDGVKNGTGWISADDGMLVLDRNGNGVIDNGGELFGDNTIKADGSKALNGFDALAELDTNNDGKVDAADAQFSELRIWQDFNQDGISQSNELSSLSDLNIQSIGTGYTASTQDVGHNNLSIAQGSFIKTDGTDGDAGIATQSSGDAESLNLVENNFYREFTDDIIIPDSLQDHPDMQGSGAVRDLLQAAALNPDLAALLTHYAGAATKTEQQTQLDGLLIAWANTAQFDKLSDRLQDWNASNANSGLNYQGAYAEGTITSVNDKLQILEVFNNQAFSDVQNIINSDGSSRLSNPQQSFIDSAYLSLRESVYNALLSQTRLKPYLQAVDIAVTDEGELGIDFTNVETVIVNNLAESPEATVENLLELNQVTGNQFSQKYWNVYHFLSEQISVDNSLAAQIIPLLEAQGIKLLSSNESDFAAENSTTFIAGNSADNHLTGGNNSDVIYGRDGDDLLQGGQGNDALFGGHGNDYLYGGHGNDTLSGGLGNDRLEGGYGQDTYKIVADGSHDVLHINTGDNNTHNRIVFAEGIEQDHVSFYRTVVDLVIEINQGEITTSITIKRGFSGQLSAIDDLEFSDGSHISKAAALAQAATWTASDYGGYVHGHDGDDTIDSAGGNDHVYGKAGNDILHGGTGDDLLVGGAGNDTLNGGLDNDELYGGDGNDVLMGSQGDDELYGQYGNDVLIGGKGNDFIQSGLGENEIHFTTGDGQDQIVSGGIYYTLHLSGISPDDLILRRSEENLVITFLHSNSDKLTLNNYFTNEGAVSAKALSFRFVDQQLSQTFSAQQIDEKLVSGSLEADSISGDDQINTIYGLAGNDYLNGFAGNDQLYGGDDNDSLYDFDGVNYLYGNSGDDSLSGNGFLYGGEGNDSVSGKGDLYGGGGDDRVSGEGKLYGGAGDDILQSSGGVVQTEMTHLSGGEGNDTLVAIQNWTNQKGTIFEGGKGDDQLSGSFADDRYLFNLGDGVDLLIESSFSDYQTSNDSLVFGSGIYFSDLSFERHKDDLSIVHNNGTDSVTIQNWYRGDTDIYKVNQFLFADGQTLSDSDIENLVVIVGTESSDILLGNQDRNDQVYAGGGNDQVQGLSGNDDLYGELGDDNLIGGLGDDKLYGGAGNDQLAGGSGDDQLISGSGNDLIVIGGNGGHDIVDVSEGGNNGLYFTDAINSDRLSYAQEGEDLLILIDGGNEQSVRVINHFLGGEYALDWIQPAGEYQINTTAINQLAAGDASNDFDAVVIGSNTGEQLLGTNQADLIQGLGGDDQLYGFAGDDQLEGGDGNDRLQGGNGSNQNSGNDVLIGGAGNDILVGEDGNDHLTGGDGNDHYYYFANSGKDTISDAGDGQDILFFNDASPDRLSYHRDGDDLLVLVDTDIEQQVRVENHFLGGNNAIYVQPSGGYTLSPAQINNQLSAFPDQSSPDDSSTNNTQNPETYDSNNTPTPEESSTSSNSHVLDLSGNDIVTGSTTSNVLVSAQGDDTLIGGTGDDVLIGGDGNDTYLISANNGKDTIIDVAGQNIIRFTGSIGFNDVASGLMKSGNDLVLRVGAAGNQVKIENFFTLANTFEKVEFEVGGQITAAQLYGAFGLSAPTTTSDSSLITFGSSSADQLAGTENGDTIIAGDGDDILTGQQGDDQLIGGKGDDVYIIGSNSGKDTIIDTQGNNTVRFIDGIGFNDVASGLMKTGDDLVLNISGNANQVRISNFFTVADTIGKLEFASGGQISAGQLFGAFGVTAPTNEVITSDIFSDNNIVGSSANDTLSSGAGNDHLTGGEGSDTYLFRSGFGQDRVNNFDQSSSIDVANFTDIDYQDLWLSRSGDDLQINISGTDDQVNVSDWYSHANNQLDEIQVGNSVLLNNQVNQLVSAMASFEVPNGVGNVIPQNIKEQMQPTLTEAWQHN